MNNDLSRWINLLKHLHFTNFGNWNIEVFPQISEIECCELRNFYYSSYVILIARLIWPIPVLRSVYTQCLPVVPGLATGPHESLLTRSERRPVTNDTQSMLGQVINSVNIKMAGLDVENQVHILIPLLWTWYNALTWANMSYCLVRQVSWGPMNRIYIATDNSGSVVRFRCKLHPFIHQTGLRIFLSCCQSYCERGQQIPWC